MSKRKKLGIKCIYILHNPITDLIYIGSTEDARTRLVKHARYAEYGRVGIKDIHGKPKVHWNWRIQRDYNKGHKFDFFIIPILPEADLIAIEDFLIKELIDTGILYNIARDASAPMKGRKHTPEGCANIAKAQIGRGLGKVRTKEERDKISTGLKEFFELETEEDKAIRSANIAEGCRKSPLIASTIVKMAEINRGKKQSPEQIEKARLARIGVKYTPEALANMYKANMEANAIKVSVDDEIFESATAAAIKYNTDVITIFNRVNNPSFPNYKYATQADKERAISNSIRKNKPVSIIGRTYGSALIAAKELELAVALVRTRLISKEQRWVLWYYIKNIATNPVNDNEFDLAA